MTSDSAGGKKPKASPPEAFTTFGDLLKYLRRRAQLTQRELAIAVGYSEPQISYLEKNHRLPDIATVAALFVPALGLEDEPALAQRLLALAEEAHIAEERFPGEPPYRGLEFFDTPDADLFFGRELLTARLIGHLREHHFLAIVVGASGSGKSSIVRAGLIPALKRAKRLSDGTLPPRGSAHWQIHILTPGAHPLEALARIPFNEQSPTRDLSPSIREMRREARSFYERVAKFSRDKKVLLVVDQFEELFTQCQDESERKAFIDNLLFASIEETNGLASVVITLRADFYAHCAQYENLREALSKYQEYIGPMNAAELRRAIEEPALQKGWGLEDGLVDLILRDVGDEPGALPLLSHALLETWKRRRGKMMTIAGYTDSGGVRGAIAHTADDVYQALNADQQTIALRIFLRLTELGRMTEEGLPAPDTRRRAMLNEIIPRSNQGGETQIVLNKLVDARLVTLSKDSAEVAHEALIREWPRLRAWLTEDRESLLLHRQLSEDSREWESLNRSADVLYRGARLAEAIEWAEKRPIDLIIVEREFLDASLAESQAVEREGQAQAERELEAARNLAETEHRAAGRLRRRAIYLAGAFVLALILAEIAWMFNKQAQVQKQIAFARELSASAISNLSIDPERSILLSLRAVNLSLENHEPVLVEAQDALHRSIQTSRVIATLRGHTSFVFGVALSPDGKRLATLSDDGTIKIWDVTSNQELLSFPTGLTEKNFSRFISFSLDGKWLVSPAGEHLAKVWDVATGKELLTLSGHTGEVLATAFSPDGRTIATGGYDTTGKLWDAGTGKELRIFTVQTGIATLAFSPDGNRLYTASDYDGVAIAWDVSTGKELFTFDGEGGVESISVSPDGTRLATGEFDTNVKIWDAATGNKLLTLFGHSSFIDKVAFSPDGKTLASASEDGTIKLWDAETGKILLTLSGHTSGVLDLVFDPNGNRIYTSSRDTTVKIWDISPTAGSDFLNLDGHTSLVYSVAYRPDGNHIATWSLDGTVRIWDATNGKELKTFELPVLRSQGNTQGGGVSYSPDGKRLAFSDNNVVKIVDLTDDTELLSLTPSDSITMDVKFSPDGSQLAAATMQGTLFIFDSRTGKKLLEVAASPRGIQRIAFSSDGKRIALANQDGANMWDTVTGKQLVTYSGHGDGVRLSGIAFSPDGKWIASAGNDATVHVWDSETGAKIFTLLGHAGPTFGVAFSPDSQYLASSSTDRTVKVWRLSKPGEPVEEPLTLYGSSGAVYQVAFSPDGTQMVSVGRDHIVHIYELKMEDLIAIANSRLTRTWTLEECQKYLHVNACPSEP